MNSKVKLNLPKAGCIETHVMTKLSEAKTKLKDDIDDIKKLSLTCDLWTSPNSKSKLGVTGHWITNDWILKEVLLDVVEIKGNHSGNNIGEHLIKIFDTLTHCWHPQPTGYPKTEPQKFCKMSS